MTHREIGMEYHVLHFEVAARREWVVNGRGVFEAGEEGSAMNEIKFLTGSPFVFCVVDFETAVWRDTFWLDMRTGLGRNIVY